LKARTDHQAMAVAATVVVELADLPHPAEAAAKDKAVPILHLL
jgi:hypothetical protein